MLAAMGTRSAEHRRFETGPSCILACGLASGEETAPSASVAADSGWIACAHARIDGADTLGGELGAREAGPAALVLAAYRRWGRACVEHLSGEFAFAIWDPRKGALFVARDRFGVIPFCYRNDSGLFAFATEPKAILALASTPRRTPQVRIAEFLSGRAPPVDETFFADIRRLPPGFSGFANEASARMNRYWRLELPELNETSEAGEAFAELFDRAVKVRMPHSERALASMLSGGLDSSYVTATARAATPSTQALATISMVFPDSPDGDERAYIDAVLEQGGYDARFLPIHAPDPFEGFEEHLRVQDGPFLAPGLTISQSLYPMLTAGTVLLSGHGGDEVVSKGVGRLHDLALAGRWRELRAEARGASDLHGGGGSNRETLLLMLRYGLRGRRGRRLGRLLEAAVRSPRPDVGSSLMSASLRALYEGEIAGREPPRALQPCGRALDLSIIDGPLQVYALEVLDRASNAAGVESRYPFWDEALVRFSLSLDTSWKLQDGWTRRVMRLAMADRVPEAVRWRRDKHNFAPTVVRGMLNSPACSPERFLADRERLAPFVNLDTVAAARSAIADPTSSEAVMQWQHLWRATALAEWLAFADRNNISIV